VTTARFRRTWDHGPQAVVTGTLVQDGTLIVLNGGALTTSPDERDPSLLVASVDPERYGAAACEIQLQNPGGDPSDPVRCELAELGRALDGGFDQLVWEPRRKRLYGVYPSETGGTSMLARVEPFTGTKVTNISSSQRISRIALSDDGDYLWLAHAYEPTLRRIDLRTEAEDTEVTLAATAGNSTVRSLDVAPGNPDRVLLVRDEFLAGRAVLVAGGFERPGRVCVSCTAAVFGDSEEVAYAIGDGSKDGSLYVLAASPDGLATTTEHAGLLLGHEARALHRAAGLLYLDDGTVVDPARGAITGRFAARNITPDATAGLVFGLTGASYDPSPVVVFDLASFAPVLQLELGRYSPYAPLVRWGEHGLAGLAEQTELLWFTSLDR
jgi:hypothetical protein